MDKLVFDTIGYTPVAVKHVINEAVVVAHFEGRHTINYHDFTMARETHEWGLRQPIKGMSLEEKRRIAYHEAGHAFAQLKLLPRQRLSKVTIIRHGQALGLSATKPVEEMYTQTKDEVMADIQTSLASRASEELFLGMALTGVTSDLEQATRLAGAAIGMFGMNGSLYSYRAFGQITPDPMLKKEIDKLLKEQYAKVKALLDSNRPSVIAMAEALLVNNELDEDEIKALLAQAEVNRAAPTLSEPIPITALTQHGVPVAGVVGVVDQDSPAAQSEDGQPEEEGPTVKAA
ncbi:MAG: hypothetical protein M1389_14265 [Chloroflexi bacterium]|nr:hypothetical protein [Chloroflexota bacterium]